MKKPSSLLLFVAFASALIFSACDPKIKSISGRTYAVQCLWNGGPNDFSPRVEFKDGGTILQVDDTTSTLGGTWTENEGDIDWTLDNPPFNTYFRGTYDDNAINGNFSDDLGGAGIFQGSRVD